MAKKESSLSCLLRAMQGCGISFVTIKSAIEWIRVLKNYIPSWNNPYQAHWSNEPRMWPLSDENIVLDQYVILSSEIFLLKSAYSTSEILVTFSFVRKSTYIISFFLVLCFIIFIILPQHTTQRPLVRPVIIPFPYFSFWVAILGRRGCFVSLANDGKDISFQITSSNMFVENVKLFSPPPSRIQVVPLLESPRIMGSDQSVSPWCSSEAASWLEEWCQYSETSFLGCRALIRWIHLHKIYNWGVFQFRTGSTTKKVSWISLLGEIPWMREALNPVSPAPSGT